MQKIGFSFLTFLFLFIFIPQSVFANINPVINEFLAHPLTGTNEWVEIYNPDNLDVSGYYIDDDTDFSSDSGNSSKKSLSTITTDGDENGYKLIDLTSSIFNNSADKVVLFDASGNIIDQYEYTDDPGENVTIGRSPDKTGSFQALTSMTKGKANSSPQPTPTNTPAPTTVPSKTPTPTKVPTPAKTPTSTLVPSKAKPTDKSVSKNEEKDINKDAGPTSVLGAKSIEEREENDKETKVNSSNTSNIFVLSVIIGGIIFIALGILMYLKTRNKHLETV